MLILKYNSYWVVYLTTVLSVTYCTDQIIFVHDICSIDVI